MLKQDIVDLVHIVTGEANRLFPDLNMVTPYIGFFQKGTYAGRAWYKQHKVEFNTVLAEENGDRFENTVIHEVSHLVTNALFPSAKQAHGPEFKRVMATLGGEPNTYHKYDVSSVKISRTVVRLVYKCSCRTHYVTKGMHSKIVRSTSRVYCKACKTSLVSKNQMVKIKT